MREKGADDRCQPHTLEDKIGVLTNVTEQEKLKPTGGQGLRKKRGKPVSSELIHATISRRAQELQERGTCIS